LGLQEKILTGLLVVFLFVACFSSSAFATSGTVLIKPVYVRDYNGTYDGIAYDISGPYKLHDPTGRWTYSTLYRDNYTGSGFEGAGSHPGVDIATPSGTKVYSSYDGEVIYATCTDNDRQRRGWGNLIIVKSVNPYDTVENIFFIYAHLREISVQKGQIVSQEQLIGTTGGDPLNDPCPGNSTGAHLHFQVDKERAGNKQVFHPWWPTSIKQDVNDPDVNHNVEKYTYNPIVFVQKRYWWSFNENFEKWSMSGASSYGIDTVDGYLWIDPITDPYIYSAKISAEARFYYMLGISIATVCVDNPAKFYWTTSGSDFFSEDNTYSFAVSTDNICMWPNRCTIGLNPDNLKNHPNWKDIITSLRWDMAQNCSTDFDPTYFYAVYMESILFFQYRVSWHFPPDDTQDD